MAHSVRAIANEFIRRAAADGLRMTNMHLQKLVYLAHGWNLAVNGEPLVSEPPEAWEYGPVFKDLYVALARYGDESIRRDIRPKDWGPLQDNGPPTVALLSDKEKAVVDRVYSNYARFAAFQLSALTHAQGSPWHEVFHRQGRNTRIDNDRIKAYFVELGQRGGQAAQS